MSPFVSYAMRFTYFRLVHTLLLVGLIGLFTPGLARAQVTDPQATMRRAQELMLQKRYSAAQQLFTDLLRQGQTMGDLAVQAFAYYGRGFCRIELWEFSKARDDLERSSQLYQTINSPPDQAKVQFQLGRLKEYFNLAGGPRSHYLQVIAIARSLGDVQSEAQALTAIGGLRPGDDVYLVTPGDPLAELDAQIPNGVEALKAALALQVPGDLDADRSDTLAAMVSLAENEQERARWLTEAIDSARASGNPDRIIRRLNFASQDALFRGRPEEALRLVEESVQVAEPYGDPERLAEALTAASIIYSFQRQYQDALALLSRAREATRQSDGPADNVLVTLELASIYRRLDQQDRAVEPLNELLTIFRDRTYNTSEGGILAELAAISHARGDFATAERQMRDAIVLNGFLVRRVEPLLVLADSLVAQDKLPQAEQLLVEALAGAENSEDPLLLAETYLILARLKNAQTASAPEVGVLYGRAQEYARDSRDLGAQYRVMVETGLYYEQGGDTDKALASYREAIRLRDAFQSVLGVEEFRRDAAALTADLYERIFLLTVKHDIATAFEMSERARARLLLDQLSGARTELRTSADPALLQAEDELVNSIRALTLQLEQTRSEINALVSDDSVAESEQAQREAEARKTARLAELRTQQQQIGTELGALHKAYEALTIDLKLSSPQYVAVKSGQPLGLAEVQKLLDSQTTLVSYYTAGGVIYAFTITRTSAEVEQLAVDNLPTTVATAVEAIKQQSAGRVLATLSAQLTEPVLADVTTPLVGIVSYGPLHALPFAALSAGGTSLGERYTLFTLPSASVLGYQREPTNTILSSPLLMAEGRVRDGWNALPGANAEVEAIGGILGTEIFTAAQAKVDTFFDQAPHATLIHLAMHAEFRPDAPLFSRLLFAQEGAPLELREVFGLNLGRTELVVLSACETQVGASYGGDEISSLNRAFLYAGTATVVASLWKVDDDATRVLMTHFYEALSQGAGPAQALSQAQAAVRANPDFAEPFYWSAFVLTGAPGPIAPGVAVVAQASPVAPPAEESSPPAGSSVIATPTETGGPSPLWLFAFVGAVILTLIALLWSRTRTR